MDKIEGVPEGWRLVRIGIANPSEWVIDNFGGPMKFDFRSISKNYCIVERIEPETRYRPFANAAEFEPHRDRWVKIQINGMLTKPVSYNDDRLFVGDMWFVWSDAFTHLRFDDGSEFGVEVA